MCTGPSERLSDTPSKIVTLMIDSVVMSWPLLWPRGARDTRDTRGRFRQLGFMRPFFLAYALASARVVARPRGVPRGLRQPKGHLSYQNHGNGEAFMAASRWHPQRAALAEDDHGGVVATVLADRTRLTGWSRMSSPLWPDPQTGGESTRFARAAAYSSERSVRTQARRTGSCRALLRRVQESAPSSRAPQAADRGRAGTTPERGNGHLRLGLAQ